MIVIDTHALVWLVQGDPRLGAQARTVIATVRQDEKVLIAPIMAWEVAMLVDKGRLALGMPADIWFAAVLAIPGFALTTMTVAIGLDAGGLPGEIHGDPADRLMIAEARAANIPLLTADEKILAYAADGHVKVIDARH